MIVNVIVFVLMVLEVLTALLLIGIILIQQSKAGGGLGAMGGGTAETVFGATAGNVLTRGTVILASIFLGITLLLAVITGHRREGKSIVDKYVDKQKSAETPAAKVVPDAKSAADKTDAAKAEKSGDAAKAEKSGDAAKATAAKAAAPATKAAAAKAAAPAK